MPIYIFNAKKEFWNASIREFQKEPYVIRSATEAQMEIRMAGRKDDTSDMLYDQLIHIGKITSYTQIINASTDDTIMIYTDNPSIIPSRFTNRISSLENADIIRKRLKEAEKLGFKTCIIPENNKKSCRHKTRK